MDVKETKLYNFYCKCEEHGYKNMQDSTEALKAKVIATDLGIKYKNITETYKKAKEVYEAQQQKLEKEKLFQESTGSLLFKLHGEKKTVSVYLSENNTFYHTENNKKLKYEGVPSFKLQKSATLSYIYHPPKAIYTGATVGGVHMGGVHYTNDYLSEKMDYTGNGYISVVSKNFIFTLKYITFSKSIIAKFKRDDWVTDHLKNKAIYCYDPEVNDIKKHMIQSAIQKTETYEKIGAITLVNDLYRLSFQECKKILDFIDCILRGEFPPTDEELYSKAIALENSENSKDLYESISIFEKIHNYNDSKDHIEKIKIKLEPIVQCEKEQTILEKEARAVKTKKNLIIAGIISIVAIIAIIIAVSIGKMIKTKKEQAATEELYQVAITYLDDGIYQDAMETFYLLNGYKDSNDRIVECYNLWFEEGKQLFDEKKYEDSYKCINTLSNILIGNKFKSITTDMSESAEDLSDEAFKKMNISQAIQEKNAKYLLEAVRNFKLEALPNSELQEIIVGTWNTIPSDKNSLLGKIVFGEDKTWTKYAVDGSVIESGKYSFISDVIDIHYGWTQYKLYELEDGYFLMCNNFEDPTAYLIWKS